jgi:hypothetical protein
MNILEKLKIMKGNSFYYQDKKIHIKDYQISLNELFLITDNSTIRIPLEEGKKWVNEMQIENMPALANNQIPAIQMQISNTVLFDCKNILMESIEKVRKNKDYIPQSDEINKNVKSIIDLAKTEIEMIKVLKL